MRTLRATSFTSIGLALLGLMLPGCWTKDERPDRKGGIPKIAPPPGFGGGPSGNPAEYAGLEGMLVGQWRSTGSSGNTLDFTGGRTVILKRTYGEQVGTYQQSSETVTMTDRDGDAASYGLEFVSDSEIVLSPGRSNGGSYFGHLEGRWQRIGAPPKVKAKASGKNKPLSEAEAAVVKFESRRATLEPLLEKAQGDKADLVQKLRAAGVKTTDDLKGNFRGQQLADLQRLSSEIEGLERQIVAVDSAILKAKAIVRRLEREEAGMSEEELLALSTQLRDAEDKTAGRSPQPLTPFDLDSTLAKALAETPMAPQKKFAPPSSGDIPLQLPATINDSLTQGAKAKVLSLRLEKGRTYQIDMRSSDFDAYLYVKTMNGITVAQDDDSGGKLNARIIFRPMQTGVFQIEASSLVGTRRGAFTLEIRER